MKQDTETGHLYSKSEFEGYKRRAKVKIISKEGSEHLIDVYTTNENENDAFTFLFETTAKTVWTFEIVNWYTKEQDDLDSIFINNWLEEI